MLGVFNSDPAAAERAMLRQAELDVDIACFGHGDPLTEKASEGLRAGR